MKLVMDVDGYRTLGGAQRREFDAWLEEVTGMPTCRSCVVTLSLEGEGVVAMEHVDLDASPNEDDEVVTFWRTYSASSPPPHFVAA